MRTFKDRKKRSWDIDVNGETIGRVKGMTGLLLTELIGGKAADEISANPIRTMEILWACCKPQADERACAEVDFLKEIDGDALEAAVEALIAEVVDFFPKSRRGLAQKVIDKGQEVQDLATRRAMETLEKTTAEELLKENPTAPLPPMPTPTPTHALTESEPGITSGSSLDSSGSIQAA